MSLIEANNHLAIHMLRILTDEKKNVFISPFSISVAMSMLLCGTDGKTALELRVALGHEAAGIKKEEVASAFGQLLPLLLKHSGSYTFSFANSMLVQKKFPVKKEYKQIVSNFFKAMILEVDFSGDNKNVLNQINAWVKEKTNNKIPKFLENLDRSTVAVLLNAVYFKGTWMQKFDKKETRRQVFHNCGSKNNVKKVDMMNMKDYFPFYEDSTHQILQLPYVGDEVAMMILLPRDINALDSLQDTLSPTFVTDLKEKLHQTKVKIAIPRFRLEYEKGLIDCFKKLGVQRVFNSEAELTDFCDGGGIFVTEIQHKAVLEVNEEGSEAAAVTMVAMGRSRPEPVPEFVADHPFMLIIYNTKNDLILFMGRVNEF